MADGVSSPLGLRRTPFFSSLGQNAFKVSGQDRCLLISSICSRFLPGLFISCGTWKCSDEIYLVTQLGCFGMDIGMENTLVKHSLHARYVLARLLRNVMH